MEWRVGQRYQIPGYGKPTNNNLKKWVDHFNKSLEPGGANSHLGSGSRVVTACILQNGARIARVASYEA
jgi:hypothetical protein